jgi:predicted secreted Zn-dependent protease
MVSISTIDPPGKPSLTIDYTPPSTSAHLAAIIAAWDAYDRVVSWPDGVEEGDKLSALANTIEAARKTVTR